MTPSVPSLADIEAIAAQLATPHASTLPARPHQPLLLLSALPPIPARVVGKIRSGAFVEMRELLADNVALCQQLQETSLPGQPSTGQPPRLKDIRDLLVWASGFMAFVAAKVQCTKTRELMAYGKTVISLAQKHGGLGWAIYDALFRQQVAAGADYSWSQLNPSLMAATVLGGGGEQSPHPCPHCQASDHNPRNCALAPLNPTRSPPKQPPSTVCSAAHFRPYRQQEEVCRRFNRGTCAASACRFMHTCSSCQKPGHGSHECRGASARPAGPENSIPPARPSQ